MEPDAVSYTHLALGVGALAALGAADWLNWMVLSTVQGFAQGFSIRLSHEFGAGTYDKLRKTVANSILLAAFSSVLLLVISQAVARPILELLQTPDEIIGNSLIYLRIMFAGIPVVMAYNILASILRSLGDGKTPLYAMVMAALINVVLDLIFVLVFHWGIAGAASATVIAQVCSGVFCLAAILRLPILTFSKEDFRMEGRLCLHLMKLGLPMAFQNAIISVGGMIVQFVVNGFGVLFIAGFTATNKLYGILAVSYTHLVNAVAGSEWASYGKELAFYHHPEAFAPEYRPLVNFLTFTLLKGSSYMGNYLSSVYKKELVVSAELVDGFLESVRTIPLREEGTGREWSMEDGEPERLLEIASEGSGALVRLKKIPMLTGRQGIYFFDTGRIFRMAVSYTHLDVYKRQPDRYSPLRCGIVGT